MYLIFLLDVCQRKFKHCSYLRAEYFIGTNYNMNIWKRCNICVFCFFFAVRSCCREHARQPTLCRPGLSIAGPLRLYHI